MLQWMGGSRRKVATSRNSTHKRQKQYFEQRKRQQQQQAASLESFADGKMSNSRSRESNCSLDILSLVNVSDQAQERKINGPSDFNKTFCSWQATNHSEDDDYSQYAPVHQSIETNKGSPVVQFEAEKERTSFRSDTEADCSKEVSVHLSDHADPNKWISDHNDDLIGKGNKLDPFKLSTTGDISLIELVGDEVNIGLEENSVHKREAHVSFSLEGLGKVETSTPASSPKKPHRFFPNGHNPLEEVNRQPSSFKIFDNDFSDLANRLDSRIREIDFSVCERSRKSAVTDLLDDSDHMLLSIRKSRPFNWNVKTPGDVVMRNDRENYGDKWDGPNSLGNCFNFLGENEFCFENRLGQNGLTFDEKDPWEQDFVYEARNHLPTKRSYSDRRTQNFDIDELLFLHPEHQFAEDFPHIKLRSPIGLENHVKDPVNSLGREESFSMPSEESCSSTAAAVMGDAATKYCSRDPEQ